MTEKTREVARYKENQPEKGNRGKKKKDVVISLKELKSKSPMIPKSVLHNHTFGRFLLGFLFLRLRRSFISCLLTFGSPE